MVKLSHQLEKKHFLTFIYSQYGIQFLL